MWCITKKGLIIQERILDVLKAESPLSTRQLALKLQLSWHTVQEHCLLLFVKKKIDHFALAGSYVWLSKKEKNEQPLQQEINKLIGKQIDAEFQNTLDALLKQFKENLLASSPDTLSRSPDNLSQSPLPKPNAREKRTTAQYNAGGEKNEE